MKSKELTLLRLRSQEIKNSEEREKNGRISLISKLETEYLKEVLKDLEDYEELKKIMGTPIQDIMKRLKILEILKEFLSDANTGTGWLEININPDHDVLDSEEYKKKKLLIKEWLDNEKNNR